MEKTNKEKVFKPNGMGGYLSYPCGDPLTMSACSGNSDANCFRNRSSYAKRLVKKDNTICNGCVYNELEEK